MNLCIGTYMYNNMVYSNMEIDFIVAFVNIIVKCKRVKRTMILDYDIIKLLKFKSFKDKFFIFFS